MAAYGLEITHLPTEIQKSLSSLWWDVSQSTWNLLSTCHMICTVCIRPEVSANRELSPKHFCFSQCTFWIWGWMYLLCEPRPSSLIVWTVNELNKCKIFSFLLTQIFHDCWYYYRISRQRNFSVGITVKIRNWKTKSISSWAPGTDEPSLEDSQKSPRGKMPYKVCT